MGQIKEKKQGLSNFLKKYYWELLTPLGRFDYLQYFLGELPGILGLTIRRKAYNRFFSKIGANVSIYQGVRIRNISKMEVGDDVHLGLDNVYQAAGGLKVHDRTAFGPGCKVWTINHRFDDLDKPIMEQSYEYKPVEIGPDVWLAAEVFVMPGVTIPEGCIVSAGSVVGVKKYPPFSIIAGNPARVIGSRKPKEKTEGQ